MFASPVSFARQDLLANPADPLGHLPTVAMGLAQARTRIAVVLFLTAQQHTDNAQGVQQTGEQNRPAAKERPCDRHAPPARNWKRTLREVGSIRAGVTSCHKALGSGPSCACQFVLPLIYL